MTIFVLSSVVKLNESGVGGSRNRIKHSNSFRVQSLNQHLVSVSPKGKYHSVAFYSKCYYFFTKGIATSHSG